MANRSLTLDNVRTYFETIRGFKLLETEYVNSEYPMRYICTCGNESKMSYKNAKKDRNCAECGRKKLAKAKQIYTDTYVSEFFSKEGCTLLGKYQARPHEKLPYVCVCGNESITTWATFMRGHRCTNCRSIAVGNAKRKYKMDDVRELFAEQGKTLLEDGDFRNSLQRLRYVCKCGSESAITLNNFFKGKDCMGCRNGKISESKKDPNITDEERITKRQYPEYKTWRSAVYERDAYSCKCCGVRGARINAHHILNYADNHDVRTEVNNGITLCESCHDEFHAQFGRRNTNADQLAEFLRARPEVVAV